MGPPISPHLWLIPTALQSKVEKATAKSMKQRNALVFSPCFFILAYSRLFKTNRASNLLVSLMPNFRPGTKRLTLYSWCFGQLTINGTERASPPQADLLRKGYALLGCPRKVVKEQFPLQQHEAGPPKGNAGLRGAHPLHSDSNLSGYPHFG